MILPSTKPGDNKVQISSGIQIDQDMDEWSIKSDPGHKIRPNLIKTQGDSLTAKVSLTDCLACSGCVTSAETVLIQKHSTEQFMKLFDPSNFVVVAISPQSLASLSLFYNQHNEVETFQKLQTVFTQLSASMVIDLSMFNLLTLQMSYDEFKEQFTQSEKYNKIKSSLGQSDINQQQQTKQPKKVFTQSKQEPGIPILSSECPGWVCYAEKVVGDQAFPFMSKVKSPQQLCGCLLKHYISLKNKISPDRVKIVTVMPCYDKKLEAVRPNFTLREDVGQENPDQEIKEVDTVLATHELVDLINTYHPDFNKIDLYKWVKQEDFLMKGSPSGWGFMELMEQFVDFCQDVKKLHTIAVLNMTSNGYLEYIFRRAAKEIFSINIDPSQPLEYQQGKNKDLKECVLNVEGETVLKFSAAYGFRNIQNVIRNIKRAKCEYDYVEIMACPGGCLNGGGQIKPAQMNMSPKDLLENLEHQIKNMEYRELVPNPEENRNIYQLIQMMSLTYRDWEKTSFKAVEKEITHNIKW
ncbi:cytosolic fe-s cluster assembly factor narfl [Stylonychia lemnae]|uniref:Cytosolic fe-s cluster assembly factor narfl n=1 Tax=Stylonychia lemnae TaxID=5949 RepID=A0A078AQ36_STYLE|nr:cytosolic fe-s cluster assembly factor narfl [Stylonychia lemnae]|eukprot:CDW83058.1 cytosolic fe-s cluster assembly factor narfl [Stylonychia lemnae]